LTITGRSSGQGDSERNEGLMKKGGCDLFRAHGLLSPASSLYQVALKELPASLIIGTFDQLQKGRNRCPLTISKNVSLRSKLKWPSSRPSSRQ
jgi:hypothetical protein